MVTKALHAVPPQITKLYDRGIKSVIPLLHGKSPGYPGWQKVSDEEAQERVWDWESGGKPINYGIRLGQQFGGLCDIDLDSQESKVLAKYYLPSTACFGRGGVITHYLYKQLGKNEPSKRFQWDKRDEKSVLLEFRASGQTMGPGSVHPGTGEAIEWMSEEGVGIYEVEGSELLDRVSKFAAAVLLLRDWQSGGRDELAVCLVGSMVRAGWDDSEVDKFILPILIEAGDEESESRLKAERLRGELESGGRVPGLKRLRELCTGGGLGGAGFERIVEWLELGGGDIIDEINSSYAVVALRGGGVSIMKELRSPTGSGTSGVEFLDRGAFSLLYANRAVSVGGRDVTADKFWIGHKDRREYLGGVVFNPGSEPGGQSGSQGAAEYNLWRGFTVDPVEGAWGTGWEIYWKHLFDDVCGRRESIFWWLIGWMAHRVQRPWQVPESAVVLIGERGDGKSSVFKILGKLFGAHYLTITNPRQLLGNFNAHMVDKVLVLADEAVWGGDKTNEGILKVMISEDKRIIEIKGKDAFEVDNCTGYGICSNNDWVVPVGRQERRFLVLRTGSGRQGDLEFWDEMYETFEMDGESGRWALGRMLYDLQAVGLDGEWSCDVLGSESGSGSSVWGRHGKWRGNRPPSTDELKLQQSRGMEHWAQFLLWKYERGGLLDGSGGFWIDDLYLEYTVWMKQMGWRIDTERVFQACLDRVFNGRYEKVRRKKVLGTFDGRCGVHKESVMRNRWIFRDASSVGTALELFIG